MLGMKPRVFDMKQLIVFNRSSENQTDDNSTSMIFNYTVGSILCITTLGSFAINGIILYVLFIRNKSFLNRINSYIAVVCLVSLIMSIFGTPMVVASSFAGHWLFKEFGCSYYGFLMTFCGISTIFILTAISVDRYRLIVCKAFKGPEVNVFSKMSLSVCFFLSFLLSVCPLLGWNKYTYEGVGTACAPDIIDTDVAAMTYLLVLLVVAFLLPLSVMVYCYWRLFRKVTETIRQHHSGNCNNETPILMKRQQKLNIELRLAFTIICIIGTFLLCWTPYAITLFLSIFHPNAMSPIAISLPSVITKTGSCFVPIAYLGSDRKIRKVVSSMLLSCKPKEKDPVRSPRNEVSFSSQVNERRGMFMRPNIQWTVSTNTSVSLGARHVHML